ncbi:hypothetical protein BP5796_06399 [Coleophoma crateriformis]|uniref:Uncharacterized protein n=1 Tax=Coleophoma crateriformis TaxID=565419 RepID=A0A3D8RNP7_9HELO|nr:hypothetical protein BP5796_06399 [Coleophoma crateriformis]
MASEDLRQTMIDSMRLPTIYRDLDLPRTPRDPYERGFLYLEHGKRQLEIDEEVKRARAALRPQVSDDPAEQTVMLQPYPTFHLFRLSGFQAETCTQDRVLSFLSKSLNPIDYTCLRLINKFMYRRMRSWYPKDSNLLEIGDPDGIHPVLNTSSCRHCVPVLHFPAHCQLHFHLRTFMPDHLTFCAKCSKYTGAASADVKGDDTRRCGVCLTDYRRTYSRGRRRLEQIRDGVRLMKYYRDGYEDTAKAEERPWERELRLKRRHVDSQSSSDFMDLSPGEDAESDGIRHLTNVEMQQRLLNNLRVLGQRLW